MKLQTLFLSLAFIASTVVVTSADAAVTFQGIYRLTKNGTHSGFLILRKETVGSGYKFTAHTALTDASYTSGVYESDSQMRATSMVVTIREKTTTSTFNGVVKGDSFVTTKTSSATDNPTVKASTALTVKIPIGVRHQWFSAEVVKHAKGTLRAGDSVTVANVVLLPGIEVADLAVGGDENLHGNSVKAIRGNPKDGLLPWTMWVTSDLELVRFKLGDMQADLVATMSEAALNMTYDPKALEASLGPQIKGQHKAKTMTVTPAAK